MMNSISYKSLDKDYIFAAGLVKSITALSQTYSSIETCAIRFHFLPNVDSALESAELIMIILGKYMRLKYSLKLLTLNFLAKTALALSRSEPVTVQLFWPL